MTLCFTMKMILINNRYFWKMSLAQGMWKGFGLFNKERRVFSFLLGISSLGTSYFKKGEKQRRRFACFFSFLSSLLQKKNFPSQSGHEWVSVIAWSGCSRYIWIPIPVRPKSMRVFWPDGLWRDCHGFLKLFFDLLFFQTQPKHWNRSLNF